MSDQPSKIPLAISVARKTKVIVWQNIVLALGVKGAFLIMGAIGFVTMWEAVFADVGVALLAILNATRVYLFIPILILNKSGIGVQIKQHLESTGLLTFSMVPFFGEKIQ